MHTTSISECGKAMPAKLSPYISWHKSPAGRKKNNKERQIDCFYDKHSLQFEHTLLAVLAIIPPCVADTQISMHECKCHKQ